MIHRWIVVVTRVEARVFEGREMVLKETLTNELGREHNRALTTDKPGVSRSRFSGVSHVHAMTGEKNPHEDAAIVFAKAVSMFLQKAQNRRQFESLLVFAEPKMMGRLRKYFSKSLLAVTDFQAKDFGHLGVNDLKSVILEHNY